MLYFDILWMKWLYLKQYQIIWNDINGFVQSLSLQNAPQKLPEWAYDYELLRVDSGYPDQRIPPKKHPSCQLTNNYRRLVAGATETVVTQAIKPCEKSNFPKTNWKWLLSRWWCHEDIDVEGWKHIFAVHNWRFFCYWFEAPSPGTDLQKNIRKIARSPKYRWRSKTFLETWIIYPTIINLTISKHIIRPWIILTIYLSKSKASHAFSYRCPPDSNQFGFSFLVIEHSKAHRNLLGSNLSAYIFMCKTKQYGQSPWC